MKIVTFPLSSRCQTLADCSFIPLNGTTLIAAAGDEYSASALSLHAHIAKNCPGNAVRTVLFLLRFLTPHEAIATSNEIRRYLGRRCHLHPTFGGNRCERFARAFCSRCCLRNERRHESTHRRRASGQAGRSRRRQNAVRSPASATF